jgi:lipopolysaccharide/colanic/teichoic acid biosynthesis glycosyltransferase
MYKFVCKPGITGLAQINGRGFLNWGETLAWDLGMGGYDAPPDQ